MGFKTEQFVKNVDENLKCSICLEVLEDPWQCRDGHTFCKYCITRCLETKRMCPVGNNALQLDNLSRSLVAKNIVENLEVYCDLPESDEQTEAKEDTKKSQFKCDWTGKLQSLAKHRETCPFQQVQCTNVNCDTNMQRRELEDHDKICEYKELECDEQCGVTLIRRDLLKHKRNDCPEIILSCPNGCERSIKRKNITKHREACPFQQVQCPTVNCNTNMQRRELEDHYKICEYKKVRCQKCRKVMVRLELPVHKDSGCPEEMVLCPNSCTCPGTRQINKIKRSNLNDHLRNDCTKTILDCPFKDQGCSVQVERQHVDKHVQDNMAAHMLLLAKQCSSLTKENSSLTEQNTTLTEQCSTLTKKCPSLTEPNTILTDKGSSLTEHMKLLAKENKELKEELSRVKKNEEFSRTYRWRIEDYCYLLRRSSIRSPTFWLCGYSWYLRLFPENELVSVHLCLDEECGSSPRDDITTLLRNKDMSVLCRLTVKSFRRDTANISSEKRYVFCLSSGDVQLEWDGFMPAYDAISPAYCDEDGDLFMKCTIQVDCEKINKKCSNRRRLSMEWAELDEHF